MRLLLIGYMGKGYGSGGWPDIRLAVTMGDGLKQFWGGGLMPDTEAEAIRIKDGLMIWTPFSRAGVVCQSISGNLLFNAVILGVL